MRKDVPVFALVCAALMVCGVYADPPRLSWSLATGSSAGSLFLAGEQIAGIVSHPPGLARCEAHGVCGPAGLIASVRTSSGSIANVLAVEDGSVDSGLTQSNILADAVAGKGAFRKTGKLSHVRVITGLYPEPLHVVVAANARIASVSDLAGKRISLGSDGSGTAEVAREVLKAYRLPASGRTIRRYNFDRDVEMMHQGKLDAFFYIGAAPSPPIRDLLARKFARLIPLDGAGKTRLLKRLAGLSAVTLAPGTYPNAGAVATVGCRALWVVRDSVSPDIVYGLVQSLFHPANRALLDAAGAPASAIRLADAVAGTPGPLHPGAERFYREKRLLAQKR